MDSSSVVSNEKFVEIVQAALHLVDKSGIKITNADIKPASVKGESYNSDLFIVDITVDVAEKEHVFHWMMKFPPKSEHKHPIFTETLMDKKEALFYAEVLPQLQKFLQARKVQEFVKLELPSSPFSEFCEDSGTSMIILDNLKYSGFTDASSKKVGLGKDYCMLVMDALAQYHAVSHAYFSTLQRPDGTFEKVQSIITKDLLFHDASDKLEAFFINYETSLQDLHKIYLTESMDLELDKGKDFASSYMNFLRQYGGYGFGFLKQANSMSQNSFKVLSHGDMWFNNVMFKHDHEGNPIEACFIDWALYSWSNPAVDLTYFFFNSTTSTMRDKHLDELLEQYHKVLAQSLTELGMDPKVYTLKELKDDFNRLAPFGFIKSLFLLPGFLAKPEHALSPADLFFDPRSPENGPEQQERRLKKIKTAFDGATGLKEIIRGNFMDMVKIGHFKI